MSEKLRLQEILGYTKLLEEGANITKQQLTLINRTEDALYGLEKRYSHASLLTGLSGTGALTYSFLSAFSEIQSTIQLSAYAFYCGVALIAVSTALFAVSGFYFDIKERIKKAVSVPKNR